MIYTPGIHTCNKQDIKGRHAVMKLDCSIIPVEKAADRKCTKSFLLNGVDMWHRSIWPEKCHDRNLKELETI